MRLFSRRSSRRYFKRLRFEALEPRHLLSGTSLPFDDSGLAPAGMQAICALPNLPVFNVHNFGATGNGVSDDTLAIRAALSAAESAGGGIIYLPTGTYAVDPQSSDPVAWGSIFTITASNIVFIGDGASNTHLVGYCEGLKDPVTNWYVTGQGYAKIGRFDMFTLSNSGGSLSNIQFRSLDINGQAGYTGNFEVGGDPTTGDGWDLNHKAIRMAGDFTNITGVLVFNCDIRNWRGEEVYGGGANIGTVDIINTRIRGTNGSAISFSASLTVDQCTIGGSASDQVYNGLEDLCFNGQFNTIENSTIQDASVNGLVFIGYPTASFTVSGCTIANNFIGILWSEAAHNVLVNGNAFSNNGFAMMTSIQGLYPNLPEGYSDFTISDNTFDHCGKGFNIQNYGTSTDLTSAFPNLVFNGNMVTNGSLYDGGFGGPAGSWPGFLVENTTLGAGATDVGGELPGETGQNIGLWTGTIRNNPTASAGLQFCDFNENSTTTISSFLTDLCYLGLNSTSGPLDLELNPSSLPCYPAGFQVTFLALPNETNWYLKADPTWNTFSSDLHVGTSGVTLRLNSQGLFDVVNPATSSTTSMATNTSVVASTASSVVGQTVTFTVTVAANSANPNVPTGTVDFWNGSTVLGTAAINSMGAATFSTSALTVGNHIITAAYSGDTNFASSTGQVNQTVNQASTATLTTSSASTSTFGQIVTLTAAVSVNLPGAGIPTGTVTFLDGATVLVNGQLDATGRATFNTSTLSAGNHTIKVSYWGDTSFAASSARFAQTVIQLANTTVTTKTNSFDPSVFGQAVTFFASVQAGTSPVVSGMMTFLDGTFILGGSLLDSNGRACLTTSTLAVGSHAITASYAGTTNYAPSAGQLTQVVNPAATTIAIASSASISVFGQLVTFTATLGTKLPGAGVPTGTVTFVDGATVVGTGNLNVNGIATFATSALTIGSHTITASFGGSANQAASSAMLSQSVTQVTTVAAISRSNGSSADGQMAGLPLTANASTSFVIDSTPPEVTGVFVRGTDWTSTFLDYLDNNGLGTAQLGYSIPHGTEQLAPLPWSNITTVSVDFSQNVTIATMNPGLTLLGSPDLPPAPSLSSADFQYDPATYTATWTFASALVANKYLLSIPSSAVTNTLGVALDGDWTYPSASSLGSAFWSGDGVACGDFNFRFNILPGDVNQDGAVTVADADSLHLALLQAAGGSFYSPLLDVNGNGELTGLDGRQIANAAETALPATDPIPGAGTGAQAPATGGTSSFASATASTTASIENGYPLTGTQSAAAATSAFSTTSATLDAGDLSGSAFLAPELMDSKSSQTPVSNGAVANGRQESSKPLSPMKVKSAVLLGMLPVVGVTKIGLRLLSCDCPDAGAAGFRPTTTDSSRDSQAAPRLISALTIPQEMPIDLIASEAQGRRARTFQLSDVLEAEIRDQVIAELIQSNGDAR
jgi:hypothetical protein